MMTLSVLREVASPSVCSKRLVIVARAYRALTRMLSLTIVTVILSLLAGPGSAYALSVPSPGLSNYVPKSLTDLTKIPTDWTATPTAVGEGVELGTESTFAAAACVGGGCEVAGLVLGGTAAVAVAYKFGDALGAHLPCFLCGTAPTTSGPIQSLHLGDTGSVSGYCPCESGDDTLTWTAGVLNNYSQPGTLYEDYPVQNAPYYGRQGYGQAYGATVWLMPDNVQIGCLCWSYFMPRLDVTNPSTYANKHLEVRKSTGSEVVAEMAIYHGGALPSDGPAPAPGVGSGPASVVRTTRSCTTTAGSTTTVTADGPTFTPSTTAVAQAVNPACPEGSVSTSWQSTVHPLDGSTPDHVIDGGAVPTTTTPGVETRDLPCVEGGASFPCTLELNRVLTDRTLRPYDPRVDPDPATDTNADTDYSCKWGPITEPVSDCSGIYTRTTVATETPVTAPDGSEGPQDIGHCVSSGLSFNPISWVYIPVKCAMIWAFDPPAGTFTEWQTQINSIQSSTPVHLVTGITDYLGNVMSTVANGSGCQPNPGPVQWCPIISQAGDWAEQSTWGQGLVILEKLVISIYFGLFWYNRISASAGSKGEL